MIFWHLNYNIVSQHVEASEQLSQCACAGLTKAVSKLSDFTMDLCDETQSEYICIADSLMIAELSPNLDKNGKHQFLRTQD